MTANPNELALELVNHCLRGNSWPPDLLDGLLDLALSSDERIALQASHALFGIVVEGLADLFEPALCDTYARLFSDVIERAEALDAADLVARYQRIRQPRRFAGPEPERVVVLSRVTLGADIAVTSVVLDAMKRRFPGSDILLAGPGKSWEMFAGDSRVSHLPIPYGRGAALRDRLAIWPKLRSELDRPGTIVVDPDSRLTQLGLLPVCAENRYFFFESRARGAYEHDALPAITADWLEETFETAGALPYISPGDAPLNAGGAITVSLGTGDNHAKRLSGSFEEALIGTLSVSGRRIIIDKGAGGEEEARVERAAAGHPAVEFWSGAFAPFAAAIANSSLYVGYDSAGQHAADASGTPLIAIFAGFASERMFARWRPSGSGPKEVIAVRTGDSAAVLARVEDALKRLM